MILNTKYVHMLYEHVLLIAVSEYYNSIYKTCGKNAVRHERSVCLA